MLKVISFANRKGGVGKTNLASNIAHQLSYMKYRVLMLDLDQQSNLSYLWMEEATGNEKDIYDVLTGKLALKQAFFKISKYLTLVPGSKKAIVSQWGHKTLKRKLDKVKKKFDIVVIDHPPGIGSTLSQAGLTVSDLVIIPIEPDVMSLENLIDMMNDINEAQKENEKLKALIVFNKIDRRRAITSKIVNEVKSYYNDYMLENYVGIDTAIPNAYYERVPVRGLPWRSKQVSNFKRISIEILEALKEDEVEDGKLQKGPGEASGNK